jgi:hypothetical protein
MQEETGNENQEMLTARQEAKADTTLRDTKAEITNQERI